MTITCAGGSETLTKAEKARMQAIKDSGCIACMLATRSTQAPDVHHLTSGGRRNGHMQTIGLCPYHHRGYILEGQTKQSMSSVFGPSYAWGRKTFAEFFGDDEGLLKVQNAVLASFAENPWYNYAVPTNVRRMAYDLWTREKRR